MKAPVCFDRTITPWTSRRIVFPIVDVRRGRGWIMLYVWWWRTIRTWALRDATADLLECHMATFKHSRWTRPKERTR